MDLEELIGLQLVVGLPGPTLTEEQAVHLRTIRAGAFIPFARNFQSPESFRALVRQLEQARGAPWLLMVDHEGGRVVRFTRGVTRFPDALEVGRTATPADVVRQGQTEARELRALGVQVNLAPCLDVLVAGADPVIGPRAYGADPGRVAVLGVARIHGLQRGGVAACAKHFPGIGAVPKDPHQQLPAIGLEWPAMRQGHLAPFVAAIGAGVELVMSSHVCYPRLITDARTPATFSAYLMRDLLRGELGFQGVAVSDDLEMGALRELGSMGEAAVRAAAAGHDLLLICSDPALQREAFDALRGAYRTGRLSLAELERSVARITRLRQKFLSGTP